MRGEDSRFGEGRIDLPALLGHATPVGTTLPNPAATASHLPPVPLMQQCAHSSVAHDSHPQLGEIRDKRILPTSRLVVHPLRWSGPGRWLSPATTQGGDALQMARTLRRKLLNRRLGITEHLRRRTAPVERIQHIRLNRAARMP